MQKTIQFRRSRINLFFLLAMVIIFIYNTNQFWHGSQEVGRILLMIMSLIMAFLYINALSSRVEFQDETLLFKSLLAYQAIPYTDIRQINFVSEPYNGTRRSYLAFYNAMAQRVGVINLVFVRTPESRRQLHRILLERIPTAHIDAETQDILTK